MDEEEKKDEVLPIEQVASPPIEMVTQQPSQEAPNSRMDTPQFQQQNHFQSNSIYMRTESSAGNIFKALGGLEKAEEEEGAPRMRHQNSVAEMSNCSMYLNSELSVQRNLPNSSQQLHPNLLEETRGKLAKTLAENESLNNLKTIYEKQILNLKEQLKIEQEKRLQSFEHGEDNVH